MRFRARLLWVVLLPLAAAAMAWAVRYAQDDQPATAALEYPPRVDLGEREFGEVAVGRFTVANRARGELLLDTFSTSCSCAGVEREAEGKFHRVETVSVPPRGQIELVVRVSVGLEPGQRQTVQVAFSSNDPAQPAGMIEVFVPRVKGGAYAVPRAVLFGAIRLGGAARQVIDLYDNRHAGRRIEKIRSFQPERFEARLLPLDPNAPAQFHDSGGRLIARIEVVGQTTRPGSLEGRIEVSLAGEDRVPDVIQVFGEVVHAVECRPATLILPRRAGERLLFSGQVLLRHRDGHSITVEVEHSPPGITAKVRPSPDTADQCWLDVEWARSQAATAGDQVVRLRVRSASGESQLEMPIRLIADSLSEGQ